MLVQTVSPTLRDKIMKAKKKFKRTDTCKEENKISGMLK